MAAESGLLRVEAALERLFAGAATLAVEMQPLARASGRFLAADVEALVSQPPADVSAMDGYALRFVDLPGPLQLIGESAAGRGFAGSVGSGQAVRIFTGAPVPAGADTVAIQEDVAAADGVIRLSGDGPSRPGAHIRRKGLDFCAQQRVASAGERLTPARIGLLAAAGHATLPVRRRARVALLATGDELVPPGAAAGPGQINSSNGAMLAALLAGEGGEIQDFGIVPDTAEALAVALKKARGFDVIVTIGGASVGDHDLVKPALVAAGATLDFWRIAMRPGKPMLAGRLGDAQVIGLPGNPVSAFVCATLFLLPLLRRMAGDTDPVCKPRLAQVAAPLAANGPRRDFIRATTEIHPDGSLWVTPAAVQDSSMLSVLASANALLIRPEHEPAVPAGAAVPVLSL